MNRNTKRLKIMSDPGTIHMWICPKCPMTVTGVQTSIQLANLDELVRLVQDLFRNGHHKGSLPPTREEILQNVSNIVPFEHARLEKAIA